MDTARCFKLLLTQLISSHQVKANVKHVQQLPASSVKVLRRPDDKTFVRKKRAPWEINLDPNAEQHGSDSPQIQMKLEPEVQLNEEEGSGVQFNRHLELKD